MGGLVGGIAGAVQTRKGMKEAASMSAAAQAELQKSVKALEAVGIPTVEAQRIALEEPELVGLLEAEQLGPSAIDDVMVSPSLKEDQMAALEGIKEIAQEGISPEDKAKYEAFRRQSAGDDQARQESILQSMAQRGALDSGAQLAAQLSSSQASADRGQQEALEMAAQSSAARRQALQQAGQMAGSLRGQEYGEQMDSAQAADRIAQFNLANRQSAAQQNLASRQNISNQATSTRNQQEQYNKALQQQDYQNQMQKQQAIANARSGVASNMQQQGQQQLDSRQAQGQGLAAIGQGLDETGMAAYSGGLFGKADGGIKYADGGMAYEDGGAGTIIPGDSFAGDLLPDRINSGEMVVNAKDQDNLNGLLQELKNKRIDEQLNDGEAELNRPQQEALFETIKGERPIEALPDDGIVEEKGLKRLIRMLGME